MAGSSGRFCRTIYDENTGRMKMRIQYLREYEPEKEPEFAKESLLSRLVSMFFRKKGWRRTGVRRQYCQGTAKREVWASRQALEVEIGV